MNPSPTPPSVLELRSALSHICFQVGDDLNQACAELMAKLTESEIREILRSAGPGGVEYYPFRLAKSLVVALTENGHISRQWGAESLKPHIRRLRKIHKDRP